MLQYTGEQIDSATRVDYAITFRKTPRRGSECRTGGAIDRRVRSVAAANDVSASTAKLRRDGRHHAKHTDYAASVSSESIATGLPSHDFVSAGMSVSTRCRPEDSGKQVALKNVNAMSPHCCRHERRSGGAGGASRVTAQPPQQNIRKTRWNSITAPRSSRCVAADV